MKRFSIPISVYLSVSLGLLGASWAVASVSSSPSKSVTPKVGNKKQNHLVKVRTIRTGFRVNCAAFTPNGSRILTGGFNSLWDYYEEKYSSTGGFSSWDVRSGARHQQRTTEVPLMSIAYSPNGKLLATGYAGGILRISNSQSGRTVHEVHLDCDGIELLQFSPDGLTIACGTMWSGDHSHAGPLYLVDSRTGRLRNDNYRGFFRGLRHEWNRNWFTASLPSQRLALCGQGISFYRPPSNRPETHVSVDASGAFDTRGRWLAYIDSYCGLHLWDLTSRREVDYIKGVADIYSYPQVAFSRDGNQLAVTSKGLIRIWRVVN